LTATIITDAVATPVAKTFSALATSGIESITFKHIDANTSATANSTTIDIAGFTGVTKLAVASGTVSNATTSDSLTLSNIASGVSLELGSNSKQLDITAGFASTVVSGAADTLNLAMTGGRNGVVTLAGSTSATGFETLDITTSGTSARAVDLVGGAMTKVTVKGVDLRVDRSLDTTVTSFDASTAIGKIDVNLTPTSTLVAKGGTGATDVLTLNTALSSAATVSGFETVVAATAGTFDLTNVSTATTLGVGIGATGTVAYTNAAATANTLLYSGSLQRETDLSVTADLTAATGTTWALKDLSGTSDTLNIKADNGGTATTGTLTTGTINASAGTGIENVNITTADWKAVTIGSITAVATGAGVVTVKASGSANLTVTTLTITNGSGTGNNVYDFSGQTGTLTATLKDTGNLSMTGGKGNDVLTLDSTTPPATGKTQTLSMGDGNDAVTLSVNGGDATSSIVTVNGDAGDDTFTWNENLTSKGVFTLNGGAGIDTLSVGALPNAKTLTATISGLERISLQGVTAGSTLALTVAAGYADTVAVTDVSGLTETITITSAGNVDISNWTSLGWTSGTDVMTVTGSGTIKGWLNTQTLTGSASVDNITGGAANDNITGAASADIISVSTGTDTINLAGTHTGAWTQPGTNTMSTVGFDVITGLAASDIIIFSDYGTASSDTGANDLLDSNAEATSNDLSTATLAANAITAVRGTLTGSTFVGAGAGADTLLIYDSNDLIATTTAVAVVIVGGGALTYGYAATDAAGLMTLA
jgi:hypothetical protein